jgi:prevent-host-death family protein
MQTIDAKDVRARLKDILDQISDGEEFVITKYGKPVALMTKAAPIAKISSQQTATATIEVSKPKPWKVLGQEAKDKQKRVDELLNQMRKGQK